MAQQASEHRSAPCREAYFIRCLRGAVRIARVYRDTISKHFAGGPEWVLEELVGMNHSSHISAGRKVARRALVSIRTKCEEDCACLRRIGCLSVLDCEPGSSVSHVVQSRKVAQIELRWQIADIAH